MSAKATRAVAVVPRASTRLRQRASPNVKREASPVTIPRPAKVRKIKSETSPVQAKSEQRSPSLTPLEEAPSPTSGKAQLVSPSRLKDRKLKSHTTQGIDGPFPDFPRPTAAECDEAHRILASLHGPRLRPAQVVASKSRAGCGDSPSVLDALVRTILSQNTSDANSTRAKLSMDAAYGGSDDWKAIAAGGQVKLEEAIRCGGLSMVKSKVILRILEQAKEKYGAYTLDHLHSASTEDAMQELLGFDGVGPKTASCVLLFCLQRDDFAVDTHVHRITGLLGWRPKKANREQTYQHLNRRIPDHHKYGLHILLVTHGKRCDECKAGGKNAGKCELRRAFRDGAWGKGDSEEVVKEKDSLDVVEEMKANSDEKEQKPEMDSVHGQSVVKHESEV